MSENNTTLEELVRLLDDTIGDYEGEMGGEFLGGYRQARHDVRQFQLNEEKRGECDCDNPLDMFAELRMPGVWKCAECEAVLLDESEVYQ